MGPWFRLSYPRPSHGFLYVVTSFFVVVIETDIYDASRGFNEV